MGESLPPVWYEEMKTSVNVYFRNSCCSLPALRQVRIALLMCSPLAQARISFGVDLLTPMTKWKSCIATLPDPPPPPAPMEPTLVSPDRKSTRLNSSHANISNVVFSILNDTATTKISTLTLHDALPIYDEVEILHRHFARSAAAAGPHGTYVGLARSEEHTSELQSRQYLECRLLYFK